MGGPMAMSEINIRGLRWRCRRSLRKSDVVGRRAGGCAGRYFLTVVSVSSPVGCAV